MNETISKLKQYMGGDRIVRILLAWTCPPLAVLDKGCLVFSTVFLLYAIQITGLVFVLTFIFSSIGAACVAGGASNLWFDTVFEHLFASIPETFSDSAVMCFKLFFAVLVCAVFTLVVVSAFDFLIGFFSFLFRIPAALIAILVCLFTDNGGKSLVPENSIFGGGRSRRRVLKDCLILLNRLALCHVFPPLAVADMGVKKMLFVGFFTLCGWYPGEIAVFFLDLRQHNSRQQSKNDPREHQPQERDPDHTLPGMQPPYRIQP